MDNVCNLNIIARINNSIVFNTQVQYVIITAYNKDVIIKLTCLE